MEAVLAALVLGAQTTFIKDNIVYSIIDSEAKTVMIGTSSDEKLNAVADPSKPFSTHFLSTIENNGVLYTITEIGKQAFSYNYDHPVEFTGVKISETIKIINEEAFENQKIVSLDLGNVQIIKVSAFEMARFGENLKIPDSTTTIETRAFFNNDEIVNIEIGKGLQNFGYSVFEVCPKVTKIAISSENPYFVSEDGFVMSKNRDAVYESLDNNSGKLPDTVKTVKFGAFQFCRAPVIPPFVEVIEPLAYHTSSLKGRINLPDTLVSIGESAFSESSISSIRIPPLLTVIPNSAFELCKSLGGSLDLSNITSIGERAFFMTKIKSIKLSGNLDYVGNGALPSKLKELTMDGSGKYEVFNQGLYDGARLIAYCTGSNGTIRIKEGTKEIVEFTFYSAKATRLEGLPASVEEIGDFAFYSCQSMAGEVDFSHVKKFGASAFKNCYKLGGRANFSSAVEFGQEVFQGLKFITGELALSEELSSVAFKLFYKTGINGSLRIPDSVTEIGSSSFLGLRGELSKIEFGKGVRKIGSNAFSEINLKADSLKLPPNVSIVGDYAFSDMLGFRGWVSLPPSLSKIGSEIINAENVTEFRVCSEEQAKVVKKSFPGSVVTVNCEYVDPDPSGQDD